MKKKGRQAEALVNDGHLFADQPFDREFLIKNAVATKLENFSKLVSRSYNKEMANVFRQNRLQNKDNEETLSIMQSVFDVADLLKPHSMILFIVFSMTGLLGNHAISLLPVGLFLLMMLPILGNLAMDFDIKCPSVYNKGLNLLLQIVFLATFCATKSFSLPSLALITEKFLILPLFDNFRHLLLPYWLQFMFCYFLKKTTLFVVKSLNQGHQVGALDYHFDIHMLLYFNLMYLRTSSSSILYNTMKLVAAFLPVYLSYLSCLVTVHAYRAPMAIIMLFLLASILNALQSHWLLSFLLASYYLSLPIFKCLNSRKKKRRSFFRKLFGFTEVKKGVLICYNYEGILGTPVFEESEPFLLLTLGPSTDVPTD